MLIEYNVIKVENGKITYNKRTDNGSRIFNEEFTKTEQELVDEITSIDRWFENQRKRREGQAMLLEALRREMGLSNDKKVEQ
jgi:hypothetical protein